MIATSTPSSTVPGPVPGPPFGAASDDAPGRAGAGKG
jgi:hypothetical protein